MTGWRVCLHFEPSLSKSGSGRQWMRLLTGAEIDNSNRVKKPLERSHCREEAMMTKSRWQFGPQFRMALLPAFPVQVKFSNGIDHQLVEGGLFLFAKVFNSPGCVLSIENNEFSAGAHKRLSSACAIGDSFPPTKAMISLKIDASGNVGCGSARSQ
jgi:hypothetical protein